VRAAVQVLPGTVARSNGTDGKAAPASAP